ncbi:MAG: LysM peptidoglycan-binding domain-containing protein [Bdellovibrionota bacterium]
MKRIVQLTAVLTLTLALLSACSHKRVEDDPNSVASNDVVPPPAADAQTDAVPQPTAENGAQPAPAASPDPNAPQPQAAAAAPTDPNAPPAAATPPADPNAQPAAAQPAQAAATPADQGTGTSEDYSVQKGDTLMKIAFETYGDLYKWKDIYDANKDKITDPNNIPNGTVLKVAKPSTPISIDRNGDKYQIKRGDTLGTISEDLYATKTQWKRLYENNKQLIKDPNRIFAGFYLYYTMTPEEKQNYDQRKGGTPNTPPPLASNGTTMDNGARAPAAAAAAPAPAPAAADPNAAAPAPPPAN